MNKEIITREMQNLIEVIREQQEIVLSHKDTIPQIELEILMGNVRRLYECLMFLQSKHTRSEGGGFSSDEKLLAVITDKRAEVSTSAATKTEDMGLTSEEKLAAAVASASEQQRTEVTAEPAAERHADSPASPVHLQPELIIAHIDTPVEAPVEEIRREEILPQASLSQERVKEFTKPAAKPSAPATLFDEPSTVADKFVGAPSLYDKIASSTQDKSIATKLQRNPVTDLKKSIGINEKFSFINDLFDGDLAAYTDAIEKLNSGPGLQEAISFLETGLAAKYNWDGESETYRKLKDLVERRFMA